MTNDEYIAEAVERRCFGGHEHSIVERQSKGLREVSSATGAVILHVLLCDRAWRAAGFGEAQGLMGRDRQVTIAAVEAGPTLEEMELQSIPDSMDSAQEVRDRSTGLPLGLLWSRRANSLMLRVVPAIGILYFSQDRCELQFAVKELARRMPNTCKRSSVWCDS